MFTASCLVRGASSHTRRTFVMPISALSVPLPNEKRQYLQLPVISSAQYSSMRHIYCMSTPKCFEFKGHDRKHARIRCIFSSSSFSALPPDEEEAEKNRVSSLTPYQKEMELRQLDSELARLQTLRGINTGELYTLRGKFKMLSRDYGMGFLAWYWTVWFATAGLTYAAIELGGVDPIMVMSKAEMWLGWESGAISGKVDPTLGQLGLVIVLNECLEPLRLPIVVMTTKPVVNAFQKS